MTKLRLIPLIAAVMLAVTMALPLTATAAEGKRENGFYYTDDFTNKSHRIVAYDGRDTDVIIPAEIGGKPVTSVWKGAFRGYSNIKSVTIPEGVKNVYSYAFADCPDLETVTAPESLKYFDEGTFSGCASLTTVNLPSYTFLRPKTFEGCTSLEEIALPKNMTSIDEQAFAGCASLKEINLPESTHSAIADKAFAGCTSLAEARLPGGTAYIGAGAFKGCTGLADAYIPDDVQEIPPDVFSGAPEDMIVHGTAKDGVAETFAKERGYRFERYAPRPANLKARGNDYAAVAVSWVIERGSTRYTVYRSEDGADGEYKQVAELKTQEMLDEVAFHLTDHETGEVCDCFLGPQSYSFMDSGNLKPGHEYFYKVVCHVEDGSKVTDSEAAGPVFAAPKIYAPPNFGEEESTDSYIKLHWKNKKHASGYYIYRSDDKDGGYERIVEVENVPGQPDFYYIDEDIQPGRTYYYRASSYITVDGEKMEGDPTDYRKMPVGV